MDNQEPESPQEMFLRFAAGDSSALLFLAHAMMQPGVQLPKREALVAAECFATLAASDGQDVTTSTLAAILLCRSDDLKADDPERSEGLWWHAAELLFALAEKGDDLAASSLMEGLSERADAGDEESALLLNELVEKMSPVMLKAAREAKAKLQADA